MLKSKKPPDDLIATHGDSYGRTVWLAQHNWDHIRDRHGLRLADVKRAIELADKRTRVRRGREKLWARNVGRNQWLCVVVAYEGQVGQVCTAIGTNKGPKEQELI